ncbi:MAG: hypothetical protein ACXVXZ_13960 [Mycobacteriaceae bacterium]
MTEPEPYVKANPAVPVTVRAKDGTWPGFVEAWRGQRVYVTWTTGPGRNHLGWLDAGEVARL